MKDPKKIQNEKEVEKLELEKEFEEEKIIGINWMRIFLLGFITSIIFSFIDFIIAIILVFGFNVELLFVLDFMQYFLFGEAGIIIFLGACLGNFGQSVAISNIKEKIIGSDPISKDSFREATFNAFTYYTGGALLLLYTMILWQVLKIIVNVQ